MECRWIWAFLGVVALSMSDERVRYDNYSVFRVLPTTQDHMKLLKNLETTIEGVSFWKDPSYVKRDVDIMVAPHMIEEFHMMMKSRGVNAEICVKDVQKLIDNDRAEGRSKGPMGWTDYYSLDVINKWLDSLVAAKPGIVSPIVVGSTYENRTIRGVKVSYKAGNPAVFIEGGMHAREWIGPATVTFILNQLLTSTDANVRTIAENFDWYIVPVANPDGYEYTKIRRLWRKTRSGSCPCKGVDPNRNWDFRWREEGASDYQCSDQYAGPRPFSEMETRSLAEYVTNLNRSTNLVAYLCFHSYSQLLMYPFGSSNEEATNAAELDSMAHKAVKALAQRYGTQYRVGSIRDVLSPVTGSSADWAKKTLNTRFTFVWELRDTGRCRFELPTDQIIPSGEETLDSVVSVALDILAKL